MTPTAVNTTVAHAFVGFDEEPVVPEVDQSALLDGAYRLSDLMGEGAMGSVWRARNVALDKDVAIKLVRLWESDSSARERLRNEARLAAKISHKNVVGVFDTGVTEDGRYYLVMELLEGRDLGQVLVERGRLPATEAVQILLPVLAGIDCAHRRKIFHRDIKPDNIFMARVEDQLVPKIVDFGIALAGDLPQDLRTTRVGSLLGTPLYMAPEQTRGSLQLDERTDIWAVATVLYELIAGDTPFATDNMQGLFFAIASHPVPTLDESLCDAELAAIIGRGLCKDPAERWTSAREFAGALASWLLAQGITQDISGDSIEGWFRGSYPALSDSTRMPFPSLERLEPFARTLPLEVQRRSWWRHTRRNITWAAVVLFAVGAKVISTEQSKAMAGEPAVVAGVEPAVTEKPVLVEQAPAKEASLQPSSTTRTTSGAKANKTPRQAKVDPNWGF